MRSIKFPNMFSTNSTNVWKSKEHLAATKQNTIVMLQSERGEMFSDPYYGMMFKHLLYDQNGRVLKDTVIDMIYTQLSLFIPQVRVEREDIDIVQDRERGKLYCSFKGINQIDYQLNTYNLILYEDADI